MPAQYTLDEIKAAAQNAFKKGSYEEAQTLDDLYKSQWTAQQPQQQSQQPVTPMAAYQAKVASDKADTKDGALGYSVDQAQKMLGKGIEAGGQVFGSDALTQYGAQVVEQQDKDIAAGGYQPTYNKSLRETYNEDGLGSAIGWAAEKTAENAGPAGAALIGSAAAAVTAPFSMPLAALIGGVTTVGAVTMGAGESAFEQEEKTGDYDAKLALGVGALIGFLDKFGAGKVIPKDRLMKMTAEQVSEELAQKGFADAAASVLKKTGIEAATETAQEGLSIGSAAIRGGEYTPQELGDRALEAAVLGGTTSVAAQGGIGTIGAATNLVSGSNSGSPADQQAAASFAQRLAEISKANGYDLTDIDKMSSQGARETVDKAHIQYTEQLKQLFKDLKSRVAVTDQDTLSEVSEKILAASAYREGRNKTKSTVGAQEMAALESLAGDTREGQDALMVLRQLNQLTQLHNDGYQGGVSKITDQFAPLGGGIGYDKGAVATERLLRPLVSGSAAISTGGTSLLAQAAVQGTGRMIDKVTGRRSVVDRFVKKNRGQPGMPGPTGPSLRMENIATQEAAEREAQEAQAQQEAQTAQEAQDQADLNQYVYDQGGVPSDQSPVGKMSQVLGVDVETIMVLTDEIITQNDQPQIVQAAQAAQASATTGGQITDMNQLISILKKRLNPDPQYWIERGRGAAQQGAQVKLTRQEENYQRGIENNRKAAAAITDELNADTKVAKVDKALLLKALQDLQLDLGINPVATLESMYARLQEKNVDAAAIDQYLGPYMERVVQQQESKQQVLSAQDEVQDLSEPMDSRGLAAPVLEREGTKNGIQRIYTQDSEGPVRGKSAFVKTLNVKNFQTVDSAMRELSDRHEDSLLSNAAWLDFERDLMGDNETPAPPSGLIDLVNDTDKWAARHGQLSGAQLDAARQGFETVEGMKTIYADGTATVDTTGKLMAWGIMSRMLSAVNQEAGFVDAIMDGRMSEFISRAVERPWTDADVAEYKKWAAGVIPKGSFGKPGTSNLNSFGDTFLKKMSVKQPDGRSGLEHLHEMISDPSIPSADIRRAFYGLADGVGIANKVLSFMLLMMGRTDVVVLDRIQINSMWDASKYGKLIYDDIADLFSGPHGLARYEALEKGLLNRIDALYETLGRPEDASVGRYHWESWVRDSGQVVAHPTMQGVYDESISGNPLEAYADLGAPEGRMHRYSYGSFYARDSQGVPYISYSDSTGKPYTFTLESWPLFQKDIQKPRSGIVPKGFKVSDYKQGYPWYEAEGVNREKLDEKIHSFGKGADGSESILQRNGEERDPNVTRQSEFQQNQGGVLNQVDSAQLDLPFGKPDVIPKMAKPTVVQVKNHMDKAQEILEVAIGKPGSKFEKGVSSEADIIQIAEVLNVMPMVFDNRSDYQAASGKNPKDTSIGNFIDLGNSTGVAKVLAAGATDANGLPITNLTFLMTMVHENIGHALESRNPSNFLGKVGFNRMSNLHPDSDGSTLANNNSLRAEITQQLANALAQPNDFNKKTLERAKKIRAEIETIQDQTEVFFENAPELGTSFLRDSPIKWEKQFLDDMKAEGASTESTAKRLKVHRKIYEAHYKGSPDYIKYKRNNAEFSVDPVILYVMNPTLMKKVAPETAKLIRGHFNTSKIPVSFHANPIATILAIIMSGIAAMDDEEEEKNNPGALTPEPGALTA